MHNLWAIHQQNNMIVILCMGPLFPVGVAMRLNATKARSRALLCCTVARNADVVYNLEFSHISPDFQSSSLSL